MLLPRLLLRRQLRLARVVAPVGCCALLARVGVQPWRGYAAEEGGGGERGKGGAARKRSRLRGPRKDGAAAAGESALGKTPSRQEPPPAPDQQPANEKSPGYLFRPSPDGRGVDVDELIELLHVPNVGGQERADEKGLIGERLRAITEKFGSARRAEGPRPALRDLILVDPPVDFDLTKGPAFGLSFDPLTRAEVARRDAEESEEARTAGRAPAPREQADGAGGFTAEDLARLYMGTRRPRYDGQDSDLEVFERKLRGRRRFGSGGPASADELRFADANRKALAAMPVSSFLNFSDVYEDLEDGDWMKTVLQSHATSLSQNPGWSPAEKRMMLEFMRDALEDADEAAAAASKEGPAAAR